MSARCTSWHRTARQLVSFNPTHSYMSIPHELSESVMSQSSLSPSMELSAVFVQNVIERRLSAPLAATSPYFFLKREVPIIASYCVYRDAEFLRSSLDTVCMYVDAIMILDGRFLDFAPLPEDGTTRRISESAPRFDPKYFKEEHHISQKFVYLDIEYSLGPML